MWAAAGMSRVEVNGVVVNAIEGDACGPDKTSVSGRRTSPWNAVLSP